MNAIDFNNALYPFEKPGNTLEESKKVCKWIEEAFTDHLPYFNRQHLSSSLTTFRRVPSRRTQLVVRNHGIKRCQ